MPELRILPQVCIQRPLMESAQGHRVAGDLPVQGTIAHEVNGGFKDKNRIQLRTAGEAEGRILVAASYVAFEAGALPICFVVLLIWAVVARKSGKFTRLSSVLAGVMLALAVCAVVIRVFDESGIRLLYVAVPAVAVLALIYYLYQREFFFAAVLSALGLLGVKVVPYHFGFPAIAYGYAVVLGVALVGAVVVFRVMQAAEGKLRLKGNWVEVLPKSANYALLYVTCGVVAAVVIAALLLGGLAVLYGVLVAWLLILAVYYTVRLM